MLRRALVEICMGFELKYQVKTIDDEQDDSCAPRDPDDGFISEGLVAERGVEDGLGWSATKTGFSEREKTYRHDQTQRRQHQQ